MSRNRKGIAVLVGALAMLLGPGTSTWGQCEVQRLTTEDTVPPWHLSYGWSVAIDGDRSIVGALYLSVRCVPPGCVDSGFAYVYRRDGVRWAEEARLSPSDGTLTDRFGETVSISRNHVAIGAWGSQAAYVFRREETGWVQAGKLVAWDDPGFNSFGRPVSISGDLVVVGAKTDDEAAPRGALLTSSREKGRNGYRTRN